MRNGRGTCNDLLKACYDVENKGEIRNITKEGWRTLLGNESRGRNGKMIYLAGATVAFIYSTYKYGSVIMCCYMYIAWVAC